PDLHQGPDHDQRRTGQRHAGLRALSLQQRVPVAEDGLRRRPGLGALPDPLRADALDVQALPLGLLRRAAALMAQHAPAGRRARLLARRSTRSQLGGALVFAVVSLLGIAYFVPFLWMLSTSLKTPDQLFTFPVQWLPTPIALANYPEALSALPFALFARN